MTRKKLPRRSFHGFETSIYSVLPLLECNLKWFFQRRMIMLAMGYSKAWHRMAGHVVLSGDCVSSPHFTPDVVSGTGQHCGF